VEPLAENVALARELAPRLCAATADRESCAWYHGFYPALRMLGMAATPDRHAAFYADALGAAARSAPRLRVLIAGAADTAMLRTVWSAAPTASVRLLDRCATPLALGRRFAARVARSIETEHTDLVAPDAQQQSAAPPCDVAVTHSLLVLLPPATRRIALEAIRARLRPGGVLISTARIDAAADAAGGRLAPDAARALAERIVEAASAHRADSDIDAAWLRAAAHDYAERIEGWPLRSADELATLARESGFAVAQLSIAEVAGRLPAAGAGVGVDRSARYAEFVLARV